MFFANRGIGVARSSLPRRFDSFGLPFRKTAAFTHRPSLDNHHEQAQGKEPALLLAASRQRGAKN